MRKLSNKSIITNSPGTAWAFAGLILFIIFVMIGGRISSQSGDITIWILLVAFIFVGVLVAYAVLWLHLFGYELGEDEIKIESGVISKNYDSIPYSRIQNVGIERSLLQRILGISTVNVQTAGRSSGIGSAVSAEGNIPGVDKQVAEQVRETIMSRARDQDSRSSGGM